MPNRKKFNARFPPARIKKIMRTDKEVGKVAAPVPAVISRALELFAEQLLRQARDMTVSRGSRTLSPAHLKQCIMGERRFDFLKELVENIPDAVETEESAGSSAASSSVSNPRHQAAAPSLAVPAADGQSRSGARPPKYLKMEMPNPTLATSSASNGHPHSAPALPYPRPPVPDLIHTSMLGMTGGALTAAPAPIQHALTAAPIQQPFSFSPAAVAGLGVFYPPPLLPSPSTITPMSPLVAHRGGVQPGSLIQLQQLQPPPLAVRYGSQPETDRADLV